MIFILLDMELFLHSFKVGVLYKYFLGYAKESQIDS